MTPSAGLLGRVRASMTRHPKGWRLYAVSMLVAALLVGIGMVTALRAAHPALTTVDEYLSALQEGDSKKALEYVAYWPEGVHPFIADKALDGDWTVNAISLNEGSRASSSTVEVAVILSTSSGVTSSGVFAVSEQFDWTILNPYVTLRASHNPFAGFGVNNHTVSNVDHHQLVEYLVFPGLVRLNDVGSELVQRDASDLLVVSGEVDINAEPAAGRAELTEAGHERLQQEVDELFDQCAESTVPLKPGCPFGATHVYTDEDGPVTELEDATWEVIEYPVVTAIDNGDVFVVATRKPGLVELTTTGTDSDREPVTVTTTCSTVEARLWFVVSVGDRIDLDHGKGDDADWHTCRYRRGA